MRRVDRGPPVGTNDDDEESDYEGYSDDGHDSASEQQSKWCVRL